MGLLAHESAALSCLAFSYAAQIQPTPTHMPSSCSYDHILTKHSGSITQYIILPSDNTNYDIMIIDRT